jgi:diguanylate cyclase
VPRVLSRVAAVVSLLALVYAVTLLPGVRSEQGFDALVDGWLNLVVDAGVLAVLVLRALADRRDRTAWLCMAAALASALAASTAYYAYYQFVPPSRSVTWADVGWLAFYPLLYVGLLLLVRARVARLPASLWLDGLMAGLTTAALAVAYVEGLRAPSSAWAEGGLAYAYPIGDLVLLAGAVAAVAMLGRAKDPSWWLICAAFVVFAVTDTLYAEQVVAGTYVAGGPLDLGWLLPRVALMAAAWLSLRGRREEHPVPLRGYGVLAVPGICGLLVLGLLFHGTLAPLPTAATVLALGAGVVVALRTALTFREVRDLTEMQRQARTDDLTGLHNRRHFYDVLGGPGGLLHRRPCAVLLIDLDRFKEVNDALGHHTGDDLLRVVGHRLRSLVGGGDVLARLGGDEYAVLLMGASPDRARSRAEEIRAELQQPVRLRAATVVIDASIGIALAPTHAVTAAELMQCADLAMYAAKRERRGVLVYDESRDGIRRHRLELIGQLRDGIGSGELVVHYQPQLDLRSGRVIGVEGLVRWAHPEHGLLLPAAFLGLAESAGLMKSLTEFVLEDALRQCRQWRDAGLDLRVAVNVSPSVLVDTAFPAEVESLLARHGLPGCALVLEVTEEIVMDSRERTVGALSRLGHAGVRVSIDDYGTGYSSLAYLKDLPVTELKLDRSFVSSMASSARSAAIVHSTVELAGALGLELVAEGVEDPVSLRVLHDAGCHLVQGHLLGRPVPAAEVPDAVVRAGAVAAL